jgi:uncharacterized membrane protein (Fun14 family)
MMNIKLEAEKLLDSHFQSIPTDIGTGRALGLAKDSAIKAVEFHLTQINKMKLIFSDRELHKRDWEKVLTYLKDI